MEEMKQLTLIPDGTPEQAQAMSLHCEIMATAQAAADSLLALGRKLKQMRDTGGYRHLGFASFGEYTEQAVGIRQRQAYNYITVVEKVPARLVEENAAAGVTKLALLGKLGPADQREVAGELANITVEELKQIIDERNGMAEQMSLLQAEPAAEAESREVDMDALRAEALAQAKAELEAAHKDDLARLREENAHALKQAERAAKEKAESAAARKLDKDRAAAQKEFEQKVEEVRKEQEARDRAALDAARREAEEARAAAEETAKRLQLNASEEGIRFALLFEQLQNTGAQMLDITDSLQDAGRAEEAARLRHALAGALQAMESEVQ
ncbi:MAG TPA: hypothetical protein H9846_01905 [Candidatus Gemmiger excrementipullorum]|uniref:DUF3102 domain-containing protein n=1 Tax=Candidatus Gemmiger excrementipullorum TaxID=2838610 RepID=A0A9D2BUM6_9FIRM|nr:hypothetical protein [Candidatus Gemmiger excrementipullorum]